MAPVLAAHFRAAWDPAWEHFTQQQVMLGLVQELLNHHFTPKQESQQPNPNMAVMWCLRGTLWTCCPVPDGAAPTLKPNTNGSVAKLPGILRRPQGIHRVPAPCPHSKAPSHAARGKCN